MMVYPGDQACRGISRANFAPRSGHRTRQPWWARRPVVPARWSPTGRFTIRAAARLCLIQPARYRTPRHDGDPQADQQPRQQSPGSGSRSTRRRHHPRRTTVSPPSSTLKKMASRGSLLSSQNLRADDGNRLKLDWEGGIDDPPLPPALRSNQDPVPRRRRAATRRDRGGAWRETCRPSAKTRYQRANDGAVRRTRGQGRRTHEWTQRFQGQYRIKDGRAEARSVPNSRPADCRSGHSDRC